MEVSLLGGVPEFLVVVGSSPAGILYAGLEVEQVDHFMKNRSRHIFNGPIQGSGSYVQFVALSSVRPFITLSIHSPG